MCQSCCTRCPNVRNSGDQVPHNYDSRPFRLDGRMNLEIEFLDMVMTTPIYDKMDAHEQLLLFEGVCQQLEIISYHTEVQAFPPKMENESSPLTTDNSANLCQDHQSECNWYRV